MSKFLWHGKELSTLSCSELGQAYGCTTKMYDKLIVSMGRNPSVFALRNKEYYLEALEHIRAEMNDREENKRGISKGTYSAKTIQPQNLARKDLASYGRGPAMEIFDEAGEVPDAAWKSLRPVINDAPNVMARWQKLKEQREVEAMDPMAYVEYLFRQHDVKMEPWQRQILQNCLNASAFRSYVQPRQHTGKTFLNNIVKRVLTRIGVKTTLTKHV